MNFFLALVLTSIGAVAAGLLVQRFFRDAAARHAVLLASLLLPSALLIAALSGLRLPAATAATTDVIVEAIAPALALPASPETRWPAMLVLVLWLPGAAIALAGIVAQTWRWRGVAARAEAVTDPAILGRYDGEAVLVRSSEVSEPAVIGIVDPIVVLPAAYDLEPAELDAVFAHELAHVARGDNLTALVVQLVCAAFWFDPLHHVARRKLVELRERAVDDIVLDRGCDAEAYVTALARSCETSLHNPAVACMSRLNLQERMESIMSHTTRRRWPVAITRGFVAAAVTVAAIAFATFAPAPSLLAGDAMTGVYDFNVRAMPHPDGRFTLSVRIDAPEGPFSSVAVVNAAPDKRTVSTTHGGRTYQVAVDLAGDGTAAATLTVTEGETIVATRTRSFAPEAMQAPPLPPPPPRPEDGTRPRPIHQVEPLYPEEAKRNGVAGITIIEASIDENGNVTDTRIVKRLPYGLDQAAADAVRQWKFEPATRDGKPVAATFNITINFRPN